MIKNTISALFVTLALLLTPFVANAQESCVTPTEVYETFIGTGAEEIGYSEDQAMLDALNLAVLNLCNTTASKYAFDYCAVYQGSNGIVSFVFFNKGCAVEIVDVSVDVANSVFAEMEEILGQEV